MSRSEAIKSSRLLVVLLFGMCSLRSYGQYGQVGWDDIRSSPERCIGRQALLAGTLDYRNPARQSFRLKQGSDTVEVLCRQLAPEQKNQVLRAKVLPETSVIVSGTVERLSNMPNSACILATKVLVFSKESLAELQRRARQQGLLDGPGVVGSGQGPPAYSPPSPAGRRPGRENSLGGPSQSPVDFEDRRAAYGGVERVLLAMLGMLVLLTTIWVGFDARANKVTPSTGSYSLRNGALVWFVTCLLLWVVAFPYYLVRRSTAFRERARNLPAPAPLGAVRPATLVAAAVPPSQGGTATTDPTPRVHIIPKPDTPWYYVDQSKVFGPMPEAYIHVLVKAGQLSEHSTLVWQEGMDGWWFFDEVFGKQPVVSRRPVPATAPPLPASCPVAAPPAPPQRLTESVDISGKSERPGYVKGICQHCAGHLEFSSLNRGETIDCPHCRKQTMLLENPAPGSSRSLPKGRPLPVGIPLGRKGSSAPGAT